MRDDEDLFGWIGGGGAPAPAVLAVPHAGRDYPAPLLANARVAPGDLRRLEDRYADRLIAAAADAGYRVLVARRARAWVDLNRHPHDRAGVRPTRRTDAGQGVIPTHIAGVGALWRTPATPTEIADRLTGYHAPYHDSLAEALDAARDAHGMAVLLDVHSMPRYAGRGWPRSADIVLGDRHGQSADSDVVAAIVDVAKEAGLSVARNVPYAGGYGVARHGRRADAIHAVQVEIARDLYLAENGDLDLGDLDLGGVARIGAVVRAMADVLADRIANRGRREAAE